MGMLDLDEAISVVSFYDHQLERSIPQELTWRGRSYLIDGVSLHHRFWKGRVLMHIFSVMSGENFIRLRFESDQLRWFLENFEGQS